MGHGTIDFGPFRLETGPDRLCRGAEEIALRPKSLGVLAYLARRPGRLVTKDELREQVWGVAHVNGPPWTRIRRRACTPPTRLNDRAEEKLR